MDLDQIIMLSQRQALTGYFGLFGSVLGIKTLMDIIALNVILLFSPDSFLFSLLLFIGGTISLLGSLIILDIIKTQLSISERILLVIGGILILLGSVGLFAINSAPAAILFAILGGIFVLVSGILSTSAHTTEKI